MVKKRLSSVTAVALAAALLLGTANSSAAYNPGTNTGSFSYDGGSGTVTAMADVTGDAGGTYYRYKGDMYYSLSKPLMVKVKGYYSSNGTTKSKEESANKTGNTVTAYATVPAGAVGVCTSAHPCTATGYVRGTKVKSVKHPRS